MTCECFIRSLRGVKRRSNLSTMGFEPELSEKTIKACKPPNFVTKYLTITGAYINMCPIEALMR
jgi:hypothetical protein